MWGHAPSELQIHWTSLVHHHSCRWTLRSHSKGWSSTSSYWQPLQIQEWVFWIYISLNYFKIQCAVYLNDICFSQRCTCNRCSSKVYSWPQTQIRLHAQLVCLWQSWRRVKSRRWSQCCGSCTINSNHWCPGCQFQCSSLSAAGELTV